MTVRPGGYAGLRSPVADAGQLGAWPRLAGVRQPPATGRQCGLAGFTP